MYMCIASAFHSAFQLFKIPSCVKALSYQNSIKLYINTLPLRKFTFKCMQIHVLYLPLSSLASSENYWTLNQN